MEICTDLRALSEIVIPRHPVVPNSHTYYIAERQKELLPFVIVWMELESIMLSEISQAVKDKYHVISPISGT